MCDIQIIIYKKKDVLKKIITELMIEKLICPINNIISKKLYYNEQLDKLEINTYSTCQCIFSPTNYIDNKKFQIKTNFNLRELMSFNDFSKFLITYTKKQSLSLDSVFLEEFNDLSILYFFDRDLYKKYARKQAEEFLKDTMIMIKNNQLQFIKKREIYTLENETLHIPSSWLKLLKIENNFEIILNYNEIKIRKIPEI